jgi:signal transduction histidine kinase
VGGPFHMWISRVWCTLRAWSHAFVGWISAIYRAPFELDPALVLSSTPAQFAEKRRTEFFRVMVLSFLAFEIGIALFTVFLRHVPFSLRLAEISEIPLSILCFWLSYGRYARLAIYVYAFGSLGSILIFAWSDPEGLNIRTVLIYSLVALTFLGSGLVIPPHRIPLIIGLLMVIALGNVLIEPIRSPIPHTVVAPRLLIFLGLFFLYSFTAILTRLFVGSTQTGFAILARAYERERQLEAAAIEFIHIASHELRTPLTPILLIGQRMESLLEQPGEHPDLLPLTQEMLSDARRMNDSIGVLLDSTQIQVGHFAVDRETCDVAQVIRHAVMQQQRQWERSVTLSGAEEPIMGMVDQQRLWQLVSNLVGNACKYSPATTPVEVAILRWRAAPSRSEWLCLRVRDHGPGIPPEQRDRLFDRYYRGRSAGVPSGAHREGLGLGLYICAAIAKAHNGTIRVESLAGEGSTFIVDLPLDDASIITARQAEPISG